MSKILEDYEGPFTPALAIQYMYNDEYTEILCPCGHQMEFTEGGETRLCTCGKVYRFICYVAVAL